MGLGLLEVLQLLLLIYLWKQVSKESNKPMKKFMVLILTITTAVIVFMLFLRYETHMLIAEAKNHLEAKKELDCSKYLLVNSECKNYNDLIKIAIEKNKGN